ncbi:zinc finger, CCHC-type containing protein [Tanacetum coccineum]
MNTSSGIGVSTESDDTMNDDTLVGVASAVKEGVTPSVVDMTVEMQKKSSLEDTTILGSFPPLSNAPGKSSYANVTGKPSGKKFNIRTLFTPGGNGIDVVVPVESIRAISERFANTTYAASTGLFSFQFSSIDGLDAMLENGPWFIRNNPLILKKWHPNENLLKEDVSTVLVWVKFYGVPITAFNDDGLSAIAIRLGTPLMLDSYTSDMCMQSWGRSSYARVMIELRADVELKENIVVTIPKITREGHYTCNVRVEYEWKPLRCTSCKVFGHIHEECPKNTGVSEKKTVKKPSQASRGVPVVPKMAFKSQKEYRYVAKKPNTSSSGNKKKGVEPTIEGTSHLGNNKATPSGSSFMNIDNDGEFASNTPIGEKIDKIEQQIGEVEGVKMTPRQLTNWLQGVIEKQKLTGPNFIDWYRQLRIVLSIEDKLNYLEQPLPPAPVAPAGQHVAPEILAAHTAWVKGSKEIAGLMLMTMELEIQQNLENSSYYE